ncbi:MAG: hypothetical protein ACJAR7_001207, partial [Polaromonas sp.]
HAAEVTPVRLGTAETARSLPVVKSMRRLTAAQNRTVPAHFLSALMWLQNNIKILLNHTIR